MGLLLHKDECVDTQEHHNYSYYVQKVSPGQDDSEVADLLGNDLVFQRVKPKQI